MTTALRTSDQTVVLEGVHWETYERLLADQQESSGTRLNYVDPPPDLVIEIEITNPVMEKLSIFSAAGVPEVWLYREDHIEILGLESSTYRRKTGSSFLPGVTDSVLSEFVRSSKEMKSTAWIKSVRAWGENR